MEEIEIEVSAERSWEPGRGGSVEVAAERAWENAKQAGAGAGTYELRILVEAENPIRTYVVIIGPTG
jgi:hypothetical protein